MGRAGIGRVEITPPLGAGLAGYGVFLDRRAERVHDPLYVRALLLEDDEGTRVALLSLDLLGVSHAQGQNIERQVAGALGLQDESVLVSCTHTHSGPVPGPSIGWGHPDERYMATIPHCCVAAAREALADLRPARIGAAHGSLPAVGFNRVRPGGPLDPGLHLLRIDDAEGAPRAVLYSYGCHPVSIDRRSAAGTAVSADWPGCVAARLRQEGFGETLFVLGACGDIDPVVAWHNFDFQGMDLTAEAVTQALLSLLRAAETRPRLRLRLARGTVVLPLQPLTEQDIAATLAESQTRYGNVHVTDSDSEAAAWQRFFGEWAAAMRASLPNQPARIEAPVAALLVNEEMWLYLPGEIFTSLALQIRERSPFPTTVISTNAHALIGYIPDAEDFAAGGYAGTLVPRILMLPPYQPTVGAVLVDRAVAILESLAVTAPHD